jgi:hypothetical protein
MKKINLFILYYSSENIQKKQKWLELEKITYHLLTPQIPHQILSKSLYDAKHSKLELYRANKIQKDNIQHNLEKSDLFGQENLSKPWQHPS